MQMIADIVLFGWIPVVLLLFATLKPRIAVAVASVGAWLFLPVMGYNIQGLPSYDKLTATSIALILGVLLFDARTLVQFRPHLLDIPIVVLCLTPFASSISNGLGAQDGASVVLTMTLTFGVPYLMGRLYFCTPEGLKILVTAIVIGGMIYVPLTLFEVRFSPQLHRLAYGQHQHSFAQTHRFGGFRPDVFMQHGLMVALWMASATLGAVWLVMSKTRRHFVKVPMVMLAAVLVMTTILCKSVGAVALLALGVFILIGMKYMKLRLMLVLIALTVPLYIGARIGLNWDGGELVEIAEVIAGERADSLDYRFYNEELLKQKHLRRPIFGWGMWNRSRLEDVDTTTDSLWILMFGRHGVVGLAACFSLLVLPTISMILNAKRRRLTIPFEHPVVPLMVIVLMFTFDSAVNAMINPIYLVAAGAVTGGSFVLVSVPRRRRSAGVPSSQRGGAAGRPASSAG